MPRIARSTPIAPPDPIGWAGAPDTADFRADGGGRALERAVRAGDFDAVLDLCLAELAAELCGGHFGAGPDRLTAAALTGTPQLVAPGGLEAVAFRDPGSVPERYWGRSQYVLKSGVCLVRTSPEECDQLGREVAHKVCASRGRALVLLPTLGFGPLAAPGGSLADAEADRAFLESFRNWAAGVEVVEVALNAGDPALAALAASWPRGGFGRLG